MNIKIVFFKINLKFFHNFYIFFIICYISIFFIMTFDFNYTCFFYYKKKIKNIFFQENSFIFLLNNEIK